MQTDTLSLTFQALSDPTRRAILARLSSGAAPVKINDDVARCKAQAGPRQKAACVHAPAASDAAGR